jgi:hypothetical protein
MVTLYKAVYYPYNTKYEIILPVYPTDKMVDIQRRVAEYLGEYIDGLDYVELTGKFDVWYHNKRDGIMVSKKDDYETEFLFFRELDKDCDDDSAYYTEYQNQF